MADELFNPKTVKKLCSKTEVRGSQEKAAEEWLDLLVAGKLKREKPNYLKFNRVILTGILDYPDLAHEEENVEFAYNKNNESKTRQADWHVERKR